MLLSTQYTKPNILLQYILWEGSGLLVLNKPSGLAVHGNDSLETLVSAYLVEKLSPSLSFKPGPLHRLDKPTSGVIVFSSSLEGAKYFSALMQEGKIKKEYLALVDGKVNGSSVWKEALIRDKKMQKTFISTNSDKDAQKAKTLIFPLAVSNSYSFIKAEILSGRTHQIRVHASFHGHPLSGDKKYGASFQKQGFFLHAHTVSFLEDKTKALLNIRAPLPTLFYKRTVEIFGKETILSLLKNAGQT
jgi:23S rRNA pseudouridine955/2504/2580 synthase